MNIQSRHTASTYINNLLLSRGLLRNGMPIEFATPEKTEGGINATMTQVMNLVHDLILRRDRESDTLSTLSQNLQFLRTTNSQQTQSIARLEARNAELDRRNALTATQERAAQATLRSAETMNRALREEMVRLKASVAQIRTQCATDLRRRDAEMARLKKHLEGRRGRDGTSSQVGVVVVNPGSDKMGQTHKPGEVDLDLDSPDYSLKQETTEFLTQLSQGLSDENDALIGLVRGTLATLRSLQGLPIDEAKAVDAMGGFQGTCNEHGVMIGPLNFDALATSTDEVLEHLRGLLTNPSFVPLEEVEFREEEIHRLREGWEMMAMRWKEAVSLMGGWKKRMMDEGDTIKLEDLKVGLKLGSGMPSAEEARQSPLKAGDAERISVALDDLKEPQDDIDSVCIEAGTEDVEVDNTEFDVKGPEGILEERSANSRPMPSPQKETVSIIAEEETKDVQNTGEEAPSWDFSYFKESQASPRKPKSRIPLQASKKPGSPMQTVAQKLERAQKEAEEARKREEKKLHQPGISKRAVTKKLKGSKRRSTLSPQELENLMGLV